MLKNAGKLFAVATIIFLLFLPSYTKMQDLKRKNEEYEAQVKQLVRKNNELIEEKRRLEEDPEYLEKVAREKMGLIKEGERVYKFLPPPK